MYLTENENMIKEITSLYNNLLDIFNNGLSYNLPNISNTSLISIKDKKKLSNNLTFNYIYLSKENKKNKVVKEFKDISKLLLKKDYKLKIFNSHIQINGLLTGINFNLYCSWLNNSFEHFSTFNNIEEIISPNNILIPKEYEDTLYEIYEKGRERTETKFYINNIQQSFEFMTDDDVNEIYWEQYYLKSKLQNPSSFCCFVNDFIKDKYFILDIGCGNAKDSFEFAQQGHEVMGLDRSKEAIIFANSLISKENYKNINFQKVDISEKMLMTEVFKKAKQNASLKQVKVMYYSRFFLHSIDEENQKILLDEISEYVEKGDLFVAEFRTLEDEKREKTYFNHYRRFINERDLLDQLKEICNMNKVILFQKGTGFSIYKDEDPFLARIIVGKE